MIQLSSERLFIINAELNKNLAVVVSTTFKPHITLASIGRIRCRKGAKPKLQNIFYPICHLNKKAAGSKTMKTLITDSLLLIDYFRRYTLKFEQYISLQAVYILTCYIFHTESKFSIKLILHTSTQ